MENVIICRLCLKTISESWEPIEDSIKMIKSIICEMDLDLNSNAKLCQQCFLSLQKSCNFKSNFLKNNNYMVNVLETTNSCNINLEQLLLNRLTSEQQESQKICRFCLKSVEGQSSSEILEVDNLKLMLQKCIPELNINLTTKPVACENCITSLQNQFSFINSCLYIEQKIKMVKQKYSQANLYDVLHFWSSNEITENIQSCERSANEDKNICDRVIKDELKYEEVEVYHDEPEFILKEEAVKIKSENMCDVNYDAHILNEATEYGRRRMSFSCKQCNFVSKNRYMMKRHMLVHKNPNEITMYKCEQCPFQTKYKKSIGTHLFTHKNPEDLVMYHCYHCSYQAKIKRNLVKHMVTHRSSSEVKMYSCSQCEYQSKYKNALKYHKLSHKNPEDIVMYTCSVCPFQSRLRSSLRRHTLTHKSINEIVTFNCNQCPYMAKRKGHLMDHMLKHKNENEIVMYKCDHCPYQSKYKSALVVHNMNHKDPNEIKMHKCSKCSYETKYRSHLHRHNVIHNDVTGSVMYMCDQCPYQTVVKSTLNRHMFFHKDEAKLIYHKCDLCSFQAKGKGNLVKHRSSHNTQNT